MKISIPFAISVFALCLFTLAACNRNSSKTMQKEESPDVEMTEAEAPATKPETVPVPPKAETPKAPHMVLSLRRTSCFGKCPVYEAKVYSDGRVQYNGKRWVENEGMHEGRLDVETVQAFCQEAEEMGFFTMAGKYPTKGPEIMDLPSVIVYAEHESKENTVIVKSQAPEKLNDWISRLDKTILSLSFNKASEK